MKRLTCFFLRHVWEYTDDYGYYVRCKRCGKVDFSFCP